jgi:nuclear cap-binding protein subunit 1
LHVWLANNNIKHCPDDYDHYDHRREPQESPDQKLKAAIIKFGEVVRIFIPLECPLYSDGPQDAEQELPQLAARLQSQEQLNIPAVAEGFRLAYALVLCEFELPLISWSSITEQPYKIPFYAALLYYLSMPTVDGDAGTSEERTVKAPLGRLILDDFWKGFQAYLDKLAWRETRLCVRPIILFSVE